MGRLLNATLGNLTELVIAPTALHAAQYMLVKASIAGAIVPKPCSCSAHPCCMRHSLKTHRELFASAVHAAEDAAPWPIGLALGILAGVTVPVTPVGGAAEMAAALCAARRNRLDPSAGIASQIALFVAPVLALSSCPVGAAPSDQQSWPARW